MHRILLLLACAPLFLLSAEARADDEEDTRASGLHPDTPTPLVGTYGDPSSMRQYWQGANERRSWRRLDSFDLDNAVYLLWGLQNGFVEIDRDGEVRTLSEALSRLQNGGGSAPFEATLMQIAEYQGYDDEASAALFDQMALRIESTDDFLAMLGQRHLLLGRDSPQQRVRNRSRELLSGFFTPDYIRERGPVELTGEATEGLFFELAETVDPYDRRELTRILALAAPDSRMVDAYGRFQNQGGELSPEDLNTLYQLLLKSSVHPQWAAVILGMVSSTGRLPSDSGADAEQMGKSELVDLLLSLRFDELGMQHENTVNLIRLVLAIQQADPADVDWALRGYLTDASIPIALRADTADAISAMLSAGGPASTSRRSSGRWNDLDCRIEYDVVDDLGEGVGTRQALFTPLAEFGEFVDSVSALVQRCNSASCFEQGEFSVEQNLVVHERYGAVLSMEHSFQGS